ncbi:hypothetical protein [Lewinella sp. 4G2]|uniref:hypothetical protein n=1 Tax=Lewinella sp. 4G2 TaxID=1803372 RepID=UPI0007B4EFC0|nr:hypothetical protein [Lewinella sp. 4G2]OAV42864.1 hypothetical protein A3850_016685 [Lewinella sp. 4G2]
MYRFFLLFAVMGGVALGLHFSWPWFSPAIIAGVAAGLLPVWRRGGFYYSFLAAFLVWGMYTGWVHFDTEGRLSDRLAVTFGVGSGWALVLITALFGGITAGLGGWVGASIRRTLIAFRAKA